MEGVEVRCLALGYREAVLMGSLDSGLLAALNALRGLDDPTLSGELVVIAEIGRRDLDAETDGTLYVATQEFATDPGDTPANQPYWARLRVPGMSQSILEEDWLHTTAGTITTLEVVTNDGQMDAEWSHPYSYRGQQVQVLAGLKSWSRSQFKPLPGGHARILEVLRGEETVTLRLGPVKERADGACQQNLYGGFAGAYDFSATATTALGNVYNIGLRNFTVGCRFPTIITGTTSACERAMLIAMLRRTPRSFSPPNLSRALWVAASTSARVIRPSVPLPLRPLRSTPSCRAN
jgi:hypothetical protein